jgi:hypothetical protein
VSPKTLLAFVRTSTLRGCTWRVLELISAIFNSSSSAYKLALNSEVVLLLIFANLRSLYELNKSDEVAISQWQLSS